MRFLRKLKKFRNQFIIKKVRKIVLPHFDEDQVVRYTCLITGHVQHRGLRLELDHLAHRLKLTGYIKNKPQGEIELEVQGPENKVLFLLDSMLKVKRVTIKSHQREAIDIDLKETTFELI